MRPRSFALWVDAVEFVVHLLYVHVSVTCVREICFDEDDVKLEFYVLSPHHDYQPIVMDLFQLSVPFLLMGRTSVAGFFVS